MSNPPPPAPVKPLLEQLKDNGMLPYPLLECESRWILNAKQEPICNMHHQLVSRCYAEEYIRREKGVPNDEDRKTIMASAKRLISSKPAALPPAPDLVFEKHRAAVFQTRNKIKKDPDKVVYQPMMEL